MHRLNFGRSGAVPPADQDTGDTGDTEAARKRKAEVDLQAGLPKKRPGLTGSAPPRQSKLVRRRSSDPESSATHKVFVGGGPRTTTQIGAEIDLMLERADDFRRIREAGGNYDIRRTVFERQDESFLGRGNAWGPNQGGGTVNTGHEMAGIDYGQRLASYATDKREALQALYRDNPVAGAMLDNAFGDDATPDTSRGMMARREQGEEERQHFLRKVDQAKRAFPFYTLDVQTNTSVDAIDLTRPDKPVVSFSQAGNGQALGKMEADLVRLNTGTPLAPPVSDAAVLSQTYSKPMGGLNDFLKSRELLDEHDKLKPETRLALGGTGLSAFDQVIALHQAMDLFEPDPTSIAGYKVTESAQQKYAGAITFVSQTEGKWIPPRHVTKDCAWTQKTDALGDSRELHAAFLHGNGEAVFTDWHEVMRGSIALALDMTPAQVDEDGLTTPELLAAQHARNELHAQKLEEAAALDGEARQEKLAESMQTLEGAKRQAYLQAILGVGTERDIGRAKTSMEAQAPLTYRGRMGYPIHRAQHAAVTTPQGDTLPDNAKPLGTLAEWMSHITSSPVPVQEMAHMLLEAGIATHVKADYNNAFVVDEAGGPGAKPLVLDTPSGKHRFDAFVVSPTSQRRAEPVTRSLAQQVKPQHSSLPDLPQVTSHRRIVATGGTASHVEDYGLNGKGAVVPGTRSRVGGFALDVNNRESATDVAPGLALRDMAAEHLAAVGIANPFEVLEALYAQHLPSRQAFDAEVKRFAPHHKSLAVKAEYLRAAEQATQGDAESFVSLASKARSGSRVKAQAALLEPLLNGPDAERFRGPSAGFADAMDQREPFRPPSRDDYFARFVDAPMHVHEAVYRRAFELALRTARQEK